MDHETEVVLVTSRQVRETTTLTIKNWEIFSQTFLRYLGFLIDNSLQFDEDLRLTSEKTVHVNCTLNHIMPTIRGPQRCCMQPIYVWSEVTALKSKRNHMTTVNHRRVQCIVQVFCMVLCEVVKKLPMRTQRQTTSTDCHLKTGENQNCGEMAMAERLLKIDGSLIKLSQRSAYGLFCMILFKRQAFKKIKLLF